MRIRPFQSVAVFSLCCALATACSSDSGNDKSGDEASGGSSTGGEASGDGDGDDTASGGSDSATGGANVMGGSDMGSGGTPIDAVVEDPRCIGEVEASVEAACNGHEAGTMACSPLDGCGNEGGCVPRVSQNDCILRGIGACGTSDGGATCVVRLNDPEDPFAGGSCVQASHAAGCYAQMNQGDCLGYDDDTGVDDLCVWEAPEMPKCVALTCAQSFPFEQACTAIPGCEWK